VCSLYACISWVSKTLHETALAFRNDAKIGRNDATQGRSVEPLLEKFWGYTSVGGNWVGFAQRKSGVVEKARWISREKQRIKNEL
jgi:hypothetical protein